MGRVWNTGGGIVSVQSPRRALSEEPGFLRGNPQGSRRIAGLSATAMGTEIAKESAAGAKSHAYPLSCSRRPKCVARSVSGLTKSTHQAHAMTWRGKLCSRVAGEVTERVDELGNVA